jgi:O-antigen ligase
MLVVQASLELWRRFPVTGTGLGTFEDAFPAVAPAGLTKVVWNRAHNDPVELLVTGGVAGLGLGMLAMASLLWPIWRLTRHCPRSEDRAAGLAALGALGAAGFHELLDFGLVIPANHLALLVILGSAAAALSPPRSSPPG